LGCLALHAALASGQEIRKMKTARTDGKAVASLVYDAKLREFRCWSEGVLTDKFREHLCDSAFGWHPVNANLYFVRAQSLSLVITNAVAEDIFSLDLKADDLTEPTTPISGTLTELPKLLPIPAAPTVVAGVGASFVSGE